MRLINTSTFELRSGDASAFKAEGYAILSHRWIGLEITFEELPKHAAQLRKNRDRPLRPIQLDKIRGACQIARSQGVQWMWIDNCCINKANAVEESESINSMFRWYSDALFCVTYLGDVRNRNLPLGPETLRSAETGKPSVWFTRGWTLQELLAPRDMQFYDMNWEFLGTKKNLAPALESITGIGARYLTGDDDFRTASIAAKMSWMAGRETARVEDIAYSMLGIFNITMSPQYGEGTSAFMRLQQTLMGTTIDESLFAWRMPASGPGVPQPPGPNTRPYEWGLLAQSPDWFRDCGRVTAQSDKVYLRHFGGFGMTAQGVIGPIPRGTYNRVAFFAGFTLIGILPYTLWYMVNRSRTTKLKLSCREPDEATGKMRFIVIYLRLLSREPRVFVRTRCTEVGHASSISTFDEVVPSVVAQPL